MKRQLAMGVATAVLLGNQLIHSAAVEARESRNQPQGQPNRGGGEPNRGQQQQQDQHAREQQVRGQEEAARQQQDSTRRQQEEAAKGQQQAQRQQQEQAQRQQQDQSRRQQEQTAKEQQQEGRKEQEQAAKEQQQENRRQQEQAAQTQQQENRRQQEQANQGGSRQQEDETRRTRNNNLPPNSTAMVRPGRPAEPGPGRPGGFRPPAPRALNEKALPINKAVSMPVIDPSWSAEEREHANVVAQNLQSHLYPIAAAQAPPNWQQISGTGINNYVNNYQAYINNQSYIINRENTFINPFPAYQYPYWYQPQPGWVFSNGFTLGNSVHVALDWLGFGWHPYYGPQPEGFVCASNYVPTPWIYVPAYGLWRVAGDNGYAQAGPPYEYTGPITVEVLEPRHVNVRDPYTGWTNKRVVNVMYLYNAFYYPEYERYGFTNRHGYFIWLNL